MAKDAEEKEADSGDPSKGSLKDLDDKAVKKLSKFWGW